DCLRSLDGRLILVVQRSRHIATAFASTLVAKGAQVVLAKVARLDLVDLPQLAAAVLNGHSRELCKLLEARKTPFVVYPALDQSEYQFTTRMRVIPKLAALQNNLSVFTSCNSLHYSPKFPAGRPFPDPARVLAISFNFVLGGQINQASVQFN